jgi:raffinose/stachyose/melibiose transport system permease protein
MKRRGWVDFLFIFPCALAFLMVIIVPFFLGIYYAMTDWDGVKATVNWVGFANFAGMFKEPQFIYSFLITLLYTVINIVLVNVVGFLMSLLATSRVKGRNFYRAGFFIPNLIGGIVLGYIWQFIFNNVFINLGDVLGAAGLQTSLISRKETVIWAMSAVNTWQYAGYIMMIYVASIQSIPDSVMEAANVDGASYTTRVFHIMMPMMASAFTITLFLTSSLTSTSPSPTAGRPCASWAWPSAAASCWRWISTAPPTSLTSWLRHRPRPSYSLSSLSYSPWARSTSTSAGRWRHERFESGRPQKNACQLG